MTPAIHVGRVYDDPRPGDGRRVLVDRLWPRGVRKEAVALDEWLRDVAPSSELRTWYQHDPSKFAEFRRRYIAELTEPTPRAALDTLRALAAAGPVTLLTASRDVAHSQAAVLAALIEGEAAAAAEVGTAHAEEGHAGEEDAGEAACWAHLICPACGAVISEGHEGDCPERSASPG